MSDKKNVTKVTENEKVMTKYDRKVQRRKEEAAKAKKEEIKGTIIGIALLVALAAFILSFPIRSYLAVNGTYIKVDGEKVSNLEFDYAYASVKNNYLNTYGSYMSMFGYDVTTLEDQAYDNDRTFRDYFEEMTVSSLIESTAVAKAAKEAGFKYDTSEDLAELKASFEAAAESSEMTFDEYITNAYGSLATWKRLAPYMEESLYLTAYINGVMEEKAATEEEINAEYEANTTTYDCVDYHITVVKAELPDTAPDGTVEYDDEGNEIAYEPTEEEIAEAMEIAKEEAEAAVKTVAEEGTEYTGIRYSEVLYSDIVDYLFDESRKAGDTTVVEDADSNRYLVVSFDGRYRDETPTHDFRAIITTSVDAQTVLDEWKSGAATEESFIELVKKYDENSTTTDGLYTGVTADYVDAEMAAWLSEERTAGDTTAYDVEDSASYILYYVGAGDPEWKLDAATTLLNAVMTEYMEEICEGVEMSDPKGNLNYLKIDAALAEADAAAESESAAE